MLKRFLAACYQNKMFIFLILLGTLTWSLIMIKSGLIYPFGMGFWGPNGHDGIWHISLINSLARGNIEMPVFSGEQLKNYHIGFDLLLALIHKFTGISTVTLYFQLFPPILAFFIGILTYKFVIDWRKSKSEALWSVFFVYFGGSLGWIVTLFRSGQLGGESMFWSQQAISTLINPPFALSLIFILSGLILWLKYQKTRSFYYLLFAIFSFGLLSQIKIYATILVLVVLLVGLIFSILHRRTVEKYSLSKMFFGSLILSLILFLPFNKNSPNLVVFQPFWFLETMMALSDRFGWLRYFSAMTNYRMSGNWIKGVPAYLVAFAIFWIGNMGTRIIKEFTVFGWLKNFRKVSVVEVIISSFIVIGGIIPMFFLQKGTPWNTIQFFYYSLFFSSILAGVSTIQLRERFKTSKIFIILLLLTIPTTFATLWHNYIPSRPPAKISNEELQALNFLTQQPEGTVLTYPFDKYAAKEAESNPPRPLYLYESTAYVSAFSDKSLYLEDEVNLDITGYNWPERRAKVVNFLNTLSQKDARNFLKENVIKYIYWIKGQRARLGEGQLGLVRIFENKEVDIYQVE